MNGRMMLLTLAALSVTVTGCCKDCCKKGPVVSDKPVRVLYLGDSLTDFDRGSNHVDKLVKKIDAVQPRQVSIYNYAIRGDSVVRMMDRLRGTKGTYALDRFNGIWGVAYDWAFVFLGHNDTLSYKKTEFKETTVPMDVVRAQYRELIALLKAKGVRRIVIVSPASSYYPQCKINSEKWGASVERQIKAGKKKPEEFNYGCFGMPEHLEKFIAVMKDIVAEEQLEYLDIYTPMKDLEDKGSYFNPNDGLHLTQKGHEFVADLEFDYLTKEK